LSVRLWLAALERGSLRNTFLKGDFAFAAAVGGGGGGFSGRKRLRGEGGRCELWTWNASWEKEEERD